jgi:hypothetical protein
MDTGASLRAFGIAEIESMMRSGWVRLDLGQSARRAASDCGNRVVSAMRPEYRFDPDAWAFPQSISQPRNHAADCAHPIRRGPGAYSVRSRDISKPAARMRSSILRSRWQPPAIWPQMGVSLCCQRSIPSSGESPCSTKRSLPCGFRTRRISRNAVNGSGIEQSVHVITTVSIVLSARGIAVADPCRS